MARVARGADSARFIDDESLRVGGIDFHCSFPLGEIPEGSLPVVKSRQMVERYIELSRELRPEIIVELGIRLGGSTALLTELNAPERLIALELNPTPPPPLVSYIERRGLDSVVRPHYGVDQADRLRLEKILVQELAGQAIDLVVDDASHQYSETLSSFETLFPHLRPGGLFVIEDWNAGQLLADGIARVFSESDRADTPDVAAARRIIEDALEVRLRSQGAPPVPFTQLALDIVLARASGGDTIRDVSVDANWVVVRRGDDPLEPGRFRLADHVSEHFRWSAIGRADGTGPARA